LAHIGQMGVQVDQARENRITPPVDDGRAGGRF
jgi:hypothetical protein